MPGGTNNCLGNMQMAQSMYASLTPAASVTSNTSTTSTYTIIGLITNDMIDLYPQSALTTLLAIGSVWVSAANTLSVQWINASGSNSTASPTAINFEIIVNRSTLSPYALTLWPTAIE
jgi:hypothetical protein